MKIKTSLFKIEIEGLFLTLIIISIFSLKTRTYLETYFICYLFIVFHELAHIFVGAIFGKKIELIKITISGVSVLFNKNLFNSSNTQKILIYVAGPISNIILALLFRNIELIYEINIFLAILNLLPIYPLDGYNILCVLSKEEEKSNKILVERVSKFIFIMLILISIIQIMLFKSLSFALFTLYIIFISKIHKKEQIRY